MILSFLWSFVVGLPIKEVFVLSSDGGVCWGFRDFILLFFQ